MADLFDTITAPQLPTPVSFNFEGESVRVINQGGEPWFVAADVCAVLEHTNPTVAVGRLDDDERAKLNLGRQGEGTIINESGLWSLVMGSRKPEAKRFKKWITSEVIPAIRKTGSYGAVDPIKVLNDPAAMRSLLLNYSEKVIGLEERVATLAPKAEALDRIATANGSFNITSAAKHLNTPPKGLFQWLHRHNWIYRRAGGKSWLAYQGRINSGDLEHKVHLLSIDDGSDRVVENIRVTPKGLAKLAAALNGQGGL